MVTKRAVRELLERTEIEYRCCWGILVDMKSGDPSPHLRERLLDFQPRLATALFALDELYRKISRAENSLVSRKRALSPEWFRRRMRALSGYRTVLKRAMEIGRGMGDSFAWPFYAKNREYLNAHLTHEPLDHTPPGIGGQGELEFLRNIRFIGDQFAIYHGITTFLRIGDITLFDLKNGRITGIGEIKTTEVTPEKLKITVHILGSPSLHLPALPTRTAEETSPLLPPKMAQRLQRQLKRMSQMVTISGSREKMYVEGAAHLSEFESFAQETLSKQVTYTRVGDGLLLVGVRPRTMSFASRLFGTSRGDYGKAIKAVNQHAREIVDPTSSDNRLVTGAIDLTLLAGATPLFWWPIDIEFLRQVFFQELVVVTIWNPAHLVRKLRDTGLTIEPLDDEWTFKVTTIVKGQPLELSGFEYFASLIYRHLMREDAVVKTLTMALELVESPGPRIQMELFLHWL